MNNKRLILSLLLVFVVLLSSSVVFAEDTANADDVQQVNNIDTIGKTVVQDEQLSSQHTVKSGSTGADIQATLNSMKDGDVLNLENGTYTDVCIYVNKSITINGNGATLIGFDNPSKDTTPSIITNTTADGGYAIGNLATLYVVKANNVTLTGLNIVAGAKSSSSTAGPAYSNALVYVESSNNLVLKDNILDGSSWGLYLRFSHDAQIVDNIVKNQAVTGILSFGSARGQIERNKVINAINHGIDVRHGTGPNVQVINNTVIGSKEGIYLMHSQGHTANYNTLINCTISSISCYGSSNIKLYNNTMQKSRIGILLGGGYSNIDVGPNTYQLNNLPYPPTFVYYIAEGKSDFQSATNIMGTHSDIADCPVYVEYKEIPTPAAINIDYSIILNATGKIFNVPADATGADIQAIIDGMADGDTLNFAENAVYKDISIYTDKNIKIFGNNATLIGYDNVNIANVPSKVTALTNESGYAISDRAVLYVLNNTDAVVAGLNIVAQYPGYEPLATVAPTNINYKTAGIRTQNSKKITITDCTVDGASWGIYMEYSANAVVTNNKISNQYTTGILNFGTGNSILANNTIKNAVNHGIDVRHGTGPNVTVFNNTISGSKEGIYLMHSKGHTVYGNTITDAKISAITCYGSGNEKIFNNSLAGSRIGILLGGGYYNVTIGENTYSLDSLPFPPTFVTYLAKVETKYDSTAKAIGVYSDKNAVEMEASNIAQINGTFDFTVTLTDARGPTTNQIIVVSLNNETYTANTNSEGIATIPMTLAEGSYVAEVNYSGTDNYKPATTTATINIATNIKTPANNTAEGIQAAVDDAVAGDIVDLSIYESYDIASTTINVNGKDNITIRGNGKTTLTGTGNGNGFIYVENSKAVTIEGIRFIDNNPKNNLTYNGTVAGWGVQFNGQDAAGGVVDNCYFKDFNQAVVVKSCNNITVKNSEFYGGYATKLVNDPTVNKEQGSKVISVGGSFYTTIENNVFDGVVLDAISIAQASGDAKIIGNTFKNNVYSIFFGGASTEGTYITGNTFINCGSFQEGDIYWDEFPVISIQKAASGVYIDNNTFEVINNNWLIAAEQGNAAHGYPSTLGDINVTNNKVVKYDESVNARTVTLLHILCRNGELNPYAEIAVTGNTYVAGVRPLIVWSNDWGSEDKSPSDIVIPAADPVQTQIAITDVAQNGTVTAVLKDINGKGLASEDVSYTINGANATTVKTDKNGAIAVVGNANDEIAINFAASAKFAASSATVTLPNTTVTKTEYVNVTVYVEVTRNDTSIITNDVTVNALDKGEVKLTLVNLATNAPIADAPVTFYIGENSGVLYTDENGTASYSFIPEAAGTYNLNLVYLGDNATKASTATSIIKVNKLATTLTHPNYNYKVKGTKKVYITLKANNKVVKGKKITLTISGKTYTATTSSSGKAVFTVKLTKKGTYSYTAKFAGDKTYKAKTVTGKVIVK